MIGKVSKSSEGLLMVRTHAIRFFSSRLVATSQLISHLKSFSVSATMAPVKKSKSARTSESINSKLQLVVKSGKVNIYENGSCLWDVEDERLVSRRVDLDRIVW